MIDNDAVYFYVFTLQIFSHDRVLWFFFFFFSEHCIRKLGLRRPPTGVTVRSLRKYQTKPKTLDMQKKSHPFFYRLAQNG